MMRPLGMVVVMCLCLGACSSPPVPLDENPAIATAGAFLKELMNRQYTEAYQRISPGLKFAPQFRFEQFAADWEAIFEKFGPMDKAVFVGYQWVPNKRVIQLYYTVTHRTSGPMPYHLVLEADKKMNYTLFLIDIGNEQPFPPGSSPDESMLTKDGVAPIMP